MKDKNRIETSYWSNGNKQYETPYVNDKAHGLRIWWYSNGNKDCETPYKKDIQHGSRIEFRY